MATHTVKGQLSKAYVCTVEECSKVFTTLPQQQAHLKSHKEKEEEGQDISAGQLDFVALLSSVGEEVITTQLGGETDGLLELVTVEEPGVETVQVSVGDWPPSVEEQRQGRMMSAGLVTLDTRAILSSQQGGGNKRRASGELGDRETPTKIKCEESITNTIPVTVQYIIEHKDGVQESTINLQDLE